VDLESFALYAPSFVSYNLQPAALALSGLRAAPGKWFGLSLPPRLHDAVSTQLFQRYLGPLHLQGDVVDWLFGKQERPPSEEELLGLREHLAPLGTKQDSPNLEVVACGSLVLEGGYQKRAA
jgi:hypothetical protein